MGDTTHSADCYKWHHECAKARVGELRSKLEETSRKAHAWKKSAEYTGELIVKLESRLALAGRGEMTWISVKDRLPAPFAPVVLLNVNRCENHVDYGDPMTRHYSAVGYLNNLCGGYWSIRVERATAIEAFTHWQPLPAPPKEG